MAFPACSRALTPCSARSIGTGSKDQRTPEIILRNHVSVSIAGKNN